MKSIKIIAIIFILFGFVNIFEQNNITNTVGDNGYFYIKNTTTPTSKLQVDDKYAYADNIVQSEISRICLKRYTSFCITWRIMLQ